MIYFAVLSNFFNFVFYVCPIQMTATNDDITSAPKDRTVIMKKLKSITNHSLTFMKILEIN